MTVMQTISKMIDELDKMSTTHSSLEEELYYIYSSEGPYIDRIFKPDLKMIEGHIEILEREIKSLRSTYHLLDKRNLQKHLEGPLKIGVNNGNT